MNRCFISIVSVISLVLLSTACRPSPTLIPSQVSTASDTPSLTPTVLSPLEYFTAKNHEWRTAWLEAQGYYQVQRLCASNGFLVEVEDFCISLTREQYTRLTGGSGLEAAWSPDGAHLAIAGGQKLSIWTPEEGLETLVESETFNYREPAWSPDGKYIAFMSDELQRSWYGDTHAYDIFIHSLDGSVHRSMSAGLSVHCQDPDWSPDSKKLVFGANYLVGNSYPDIVMVDIEDPGTPVFLTHNEHSTMSTSLLEPHWSPDGELIAYITRSGDSTYTLQLFVMHKDGSQVQQVTWGADIVTYLYELDTFYWLPDGRSILISNRLVEIETGAWKYVIPESVPADDPNNYNVPEVWLMPHPGISTVPLPDPPCGHRWIRFAPGMDAVVTGEPGDVPNRVRSEPSLAGEIIYQLYPQTFMHILEGPVCADGLVFWKVANAAIPGGSGWMAEGDGAEYYLEPYNP